MSDLSGSWGSRRRGVESVPPAPGLLRLRWLGWLVGPLGVALLLLANPAAQAQNVQGKVVSVGYPFSSLYTHTIRESQWFPILVELQTTEPQVTLDLRVECSDLDGDRIHYDREAITLGASDGLRRIWCYGITSRQGSGFSMALRLPRSVDLLADGHKFASLDLPNFTVAGPMDKLILDISATSVTHLTMIQSAADLEDPAIAAHRFYRKYYIARAEAANAIPDQWYGLEPLDVVVWDLADPRSGQIGRNQLNALLKWVERGGHLIVGIGDQADVIRGAELADYLPVILTGGARQVSEFPNFNAAYMAEALRGPLSAPVAVANCRPRDGALQIMKLGNTQTPLIAMHQVGSGRVTATTAPLRALLRAGIEEQALLTLLDFNQITDAYKENEQSLIMSIQSTLANAQLAPNVQSAVSFARQGGVLALLATFFVASYIALATLVSWFWLRKLNRLAMSWPIFGLFAIAASFLSLGTVRVSRGLTATVHELCLVDMQADSSKATAACWFGYRSPNRERPTFTLPTVYEDRQVLTDNYLRPLAPLENSRYATPQPYTARVGFAELDNVLIRSTVKQFEGFWQGTLEGTVQPSLTADRATGKLTDRSSLTNYLPDDIQAGAIVYIDPRTIDPRTPDDVPLKAAGLIRSHRPEFLNQVPPAANVLVVPLGELKSGDTLRSDSWRAFYDQIQLGQQAALRRANVDPKLVPDLTTLRDVQHGNWNLTGWTTATRALAQLSFHDLDLPGGSFLEFNTAGPRLSTAGLVDYDISHWLVRGQAVLLLVVDKPGPAVLYRNGEAWPASQGETLYRIRVPLKYIGQPIRQTVNRGVSP